MSTMKRALKIAGAAAIVGAGAAALARARKNSEWKRVHSNLAAALETEGLRTGKISTASSRGKTLGFTVDLDPTDMTGDALSQALTRAGGAVSRKHPLRSFHFDQNEHNVLVKMTRNANEPRAKLLRGKQVLHYNPVTKEWELQA